MSKYSRLTAAFLVCTMGWAVCASAAQDVESVMDAIVTRLYETMDTEALAALNIEQVQALLTDEEREVLATKHWHFTVDVPVTVSVLRNVEQQTVPFWLPERGFERTGLAVTNAEGWRYEVWQRNFPAGRVELGINGFDSFRPHYLVCVGPQSPGAAVTLSDFHPKDQLPVEMAPGAMTYRDWTELVLVEVPDALLGQTLLTTIRGRSIEASLVGGAFRQTPFPSSIAPAPVYLTWSGNPKTSMTVNWRTSPEVEDGVVRYRVAGASGAFSEVQAESRRMNDRMLANDPVCNWHSAELRGLTPGTTYEFQAGSPSAGAWNALTTFDTARADTAPFTFLFCSDTHSNEQWGKLLETDNQRHPPAAFCVISGDLVGTGHERDDWDAFLSYGEPMFRSRPVLPAIGNHDAQLGIPPEMYRAIFPLPDNGPPDWEPGRAYRIEYSNTELFVLDVMGAIERQAVWLRDALEASAAEWKIAVFHFPMYTNEPRYPHLHEAWGSLFDAYEVDLVLTGHVHTHLRTHPMRAGQRAEPPARGTVYLTSVSIPSRDFDTSRPLPEHVAAWVGGGLLCSVITVDGNELHYQAMGIDGTVKDAFTITK